ncbi:hypothetical protein LTR56_007203 [Elasticomyces elasticus]|nr:hypothetical protein LTR56_007203 [Elasticomyces elasticus]KAK3663066.1 hypothetical protein LTR22_006230 [Elasticomyces elasticus]KAK4914457.1 hypothetical protein LTR49_017262 [Elasticomyces elasticus]KAK5753457.1 hypothetical protein LTS12_016409 [Elasticomyces elasticus]
MDRLKWPATGGLVTCTILLCRSIPTTFALDKPVHTSAVVLASCAATILGLSRLLPQELGARSHKGQQYDAVPLGDLGQPHSSREASPSPDDVRYPSSLRKLRILFLVLVIAICVRVELLREVLTNIQCATTSWEPIIPFLFAVLDYLTVQRHQKRFESEEEKPDSSVYDWLESSWTTARYRYVAATALLAYGAIDGLASGSSPRSTFICAAALPYRWTVPLVQHIGTLLDCVILYCVAQLLHQQEGRGQRGLRLRFMSIAWAGLFAAVITLVAGAVYYYFADYDRNWITTISSLYFWSTMRLSTLIMLTTVCTILCIHHVGVMTTSTIATFVAASTLTFGQAWNNSHPFPPTPTGMAFIAICLAIFGFASYLHIESMEDRASSSTSPTFAKVPSWLYLVLLILFSVRAGLWASHSNTVTYHPIDMLIYEAQTHHEAYINQTSASTSLNEAAQTYKARYQRRPPPGFQHWYSYATARNSVVIDDFDSVHRDLLPFFALTPDEVRHRTWQLIANPWNDVAGLSIRSGKVAVMEGVVPTHRWMLDGLVDMIGHFAEWLPDMDLAFNVNDECRVAVPYEQMEHMRQIGASAAPEEKMKNVFSDGRTEQWETMPTEPITETPLIEFSWQHTFHGFGNVGCPPGSPARAQRTWDVGTLCTSCTHPHSLGAFLANWTLAGNVCHQPDLADLHGVYLSPAAFKGAHELYPVFSQSKVHGFNDILYPSAWNYIDKAKYDPSPEHPDAPWAEKNSSLFWRGATSEGVSPGAGQWRGMTRQRLIHAANDINGSTAPRPILLPTHKSTSEGHSTLAYTTWPISTLAELLSVDVHVVEFIARCGGKDCTDQAAEFAPLVAPSDFQDHWKYKYLLDLDGAGFSGRFLPFLHSHSLPFKAALFREWWDDRVTPWQHFVPIDVRGHGFWATLAYFAGLKGTARLTGKEIVLEAHEMEGERIAERGRNWAGQVLRREDMEIYFFRLLLEWGRLTDDARDSIGYVDAG